MKDSGPVNAQTGKPRTLLYDLETSPNLAYVWGKYEQDALGDFVKERQIISFAYKWLGEKEVHAWALPMFKGYDRDRDNNKALILKLHEVMSQADIVVAHNGNEFDNKMANSDFARHGLNPIQPYKTVDTLRVARDKFRFNSNKLNDLGALLGCGKKVSTGGFDLWARCMRGDKKAWAHMVLYNKVDVLLLEKVYLKLRPWMTNHPDVNAFDQNDGCPVCRSKNLMSRGFSLVAGGKRHRFQCKDCGKWAQGKLISRAGVKGWKFR